MTGGEICIWLYDVDSDIQRICNSLNYNIICPCSLPCHIIHIVLPRVFIVAFYIQLRVMQNMLNSKRAYIQNDTQGCYIAGMRPHGKKQFPSPNTLTGILPSSDNLDSNNETELTCLAHGAFLSLFIWVKGPGFSSTSPFNAIMRWATHSICTQLRAL